MSTSMDNTPQAQTPETTEASGVSRRGFLGGAGAAAAGLAAGAVTLGELATPAPAAAAFETPTQRRTSSYNVRVSAAQYWRNQPVVSHPNNGDEAAYPNRIGNFSKGLPHNSFGEVNPTAYSSLLTAVNTGLASDWNAVQMSPGGRRMVSPQAGLAYDLEGVDAQAIAVAPPPALASKERAGEMVEHYWMALLRDTNMDAYASSPVAAAACTDLNAFGADFKGPKSGGVVTPQTLFRDTAPGCTVGPYFSQFFYLAAPFGSEFVDRRFWTTMPVNYGKTFANYLAIQNGFVPETMQFLGNRRYCINGRDIAAWLRVDVLYQAYFNAFLTMAQPPDASDIGGGIGCPLNPTNPLIGNPTQDGFTTFGGPYLATILTEVSTRALKATWHKKWQVHRNLRPEAMAGRVHVHQIASPGRYNGALHPSLFSSSVLAQIQSHNGGSLMLPLAFPEGSPVHPSYTAGHATVAGACVTMLKALFDTQNFVIPNPLVPTSDGSALVPYVGPALTVEGELNKLASNVGTGRNIAGVHWRADSFASMRLGQAIAVSILRDQKQTYNEATPTYNFRGFDGELILI